MKSAKLKEILKKINLNPNMRQLYASKVNRVLNFLNNSTGLRNAGVKLSGSYGKKTETRKSDIDVIFCTSPEKPHQEIRSNILDKAKTAFGKVANVKPGDKVIHIDFSSPKCNIDLVYLTQKKFQEESKKIKTIRKMRPLHKNAIKLVKYAFDKAKIKEIKGYEVELACLNLKYNSLRDCTQYLIKYFRGRIEDKGLKLKDVMKHLI